MYIQCNVLNTHWTYKLEVIYINEICFRYVVLKHMLHVASALDPHFEAFLSSEACDDKFSGLMMEAAALKQTRYLM